MAESIEEEVRDHEVRIRVLERDNTANTQRIEALEKKMDKIESNTTWILRLVIGAIIAALLGLIFQGGI